jgi:DNA-binding MarR family transcriptional regulator
MKPEQPFDGVALLDRLVHDPARLSLLTALSACRSADFVYLQGLTGLSAGNLSANIAKLRDAGFVTIEKTFTRSYPRTTVALTKAGREAVTRHWKKLDQLRRAARQWRAVPDPKPARG